MSCDEIIENEELSTSDLYKKLIESNERVLNSNTEINVKIDKLQNILKEQEKKLQKKDEKLISLIISQLYNVKDKTSSSDNVLNNIYKKFKTIIE